MGYKIGVPSLKLNNAGTRSKHCGSFGGVAYEGLEERKGLDMDINPEMSQHNVYTGYRSAAELMEYSAKHLQELRDASGRKIRADAVVMCATIFKPPAAYMNSLSMADQHRLLGDCLEFFAPVVGKENIKSTAEHFDEKGGHLHVFWEPMTADGRLCAKELHNIKFFGYINEHLPAFLRERGWEIDDADCYDRAQRERAEMEAEEERYQKRKQQGRSSAAYKLDAEKQRQELLRQNEGLTADNSRLIGKNGLLEMELANMETEAEQKKKDNARLDEQNDDLRFQNKVLRDNLLEQAELKTVAEYQAQVIDNDRQLADLRKMVRGVTIDAAKEGVTWGGVQRMISNLMDNMANIIEQLRIKIHRVKLFEALHNIYEKAAGLRQEHELNDIIADAYGRSEKTAQGGQSRQKDEPVK